MNTKFFCEKTPQKNNVNSLHHMVFVQYIFFSPKFASIGRVSCQSIERDCRRDEPKFLRAADKGEEPIWSVVAATTQMGAQHPKEFSPLPFL